MKTLINRFSLPLLCIIASVFFIQCSGDKINFLLKNSAEAVNKSCPEQINETTILDSCQALPHKVLRYNYTWTDVDSLANLDISIFELLNEKEIVSHIQQYPSDYGALLDINTTFEYAYYSNKGKLMTIVKVSPELYRKKIDMQSDEYVSAELNRVVGVVKSHLPFPDEIEELTDIAVLHPRTIVFNLREVMIEKTASFDTIEFKSKEKTTITENITDNFYYTLFDEANLTYRYLYSDKNGEYLCTLDIVPEDYKEVTPE